MLRFVVVASATIIFACIQIFGQNCNNGDPCIAGQCPSPNEYCDNQTNFCCTTATTPPTNSSYNCTDTISGCSQYLSVCSNVQYAPLLSKYCRKTCNMCGPDCKDQSANCTTWNQGTDPFCKDSFYANYTCFCAKSCGLCNSPCGLSESFMR